MTNDAESNARSSPERSISLLQRGYTLSWNDELLDLEELTSRLVLMRGEAIVSEPDLYFINYGIDDPRG